MKWKLNPFVVAFVLGAVVLTVLPLLQRRWLRAPAPVMELPPWSLVDASGAAVTSASLQGKVWLASFVPKGCGEPCRAREEAFGRSQDHIDDLSGKLLLVSFVEDEPLPQSSGQWYRLGGPGLSGVFASFWEGWVRWAGTDAGTSAAEFARIPAFAVVDQQGALRGFWPDDTVGRGNAINAARLLAEQGASVGRK